MLTIIIIILEIILAEFVCVKVSALYIHNNNDADVCACMHACVYMCVCVCVDTCMHVHVGDSEG